MSESLVNFFRTLWKIRRLDSKVIMLLFAQTLEHRNNFKSDSVTTYIVSSTAQFTLLAGAHLQARTCSLDLPEALGRED
jgi:hypothetical protein